ncbi:unnamed protein product [Rotaria sordida]|uniref:Glycosyl hydrolase-like 10 domain-containing protein n=1 Tax=Rotaria sordida TaxID=392033 RepID=A0A819LEI7_9BILA|nr:unnamed protein product [Rotaria sordida]
MTDSGADRHEFRRRLLSDEVQPSPSYDLSSDYDELDRNRYTVDNYGFYGTTAASDLAGSTVIHTHSSEETNEYIRRSTDVYKDPNPKIVRRAGSESPVTYEQRIVVRYLQPPTVPEPGPIIIKEVRPPQPPPPEPLVVREHPPRPPSPPPLIFRERPPTPPPFVPSETTTRYLPEIPVPPRSVIIERLPPPPEKPRDIIIERWIPYGPQSERRTIVESAPPATIYPEARNTIVINEAVQAHIVRKFQNLGVTQENPADYVARYGTSLLDPATLVHRVHDAGVHEDIIKMILTLITIIFGCTLSFLSFQVQANTCNTYNHPQYGTGQCIDRNLCPNSLYLSGLCELQPSNIVCCFSVEPMKEEFRAIWIATVTNIDWPSSKTATPAEQQSELLNILNKVEELNMNAVIFQIRPASDAFYSSSLEPWSFYLTGTQGVAPSPFWDPLAFIINEAHKRNIEVHAWLNPYRARTGGATYELAPTNMAKRFPEYAYPYANNIWMDPGAAVVQQFTVNVTADIVSRYAVDGIHIDDYFYPYSDGTEFPDAATYAAYQAQGGKLNKADWRRLNVNNLIQSMYTTMHAIRPKVKFGVSPFGIWKSGTPAGITGLSSYDSLYADSRMWLEQGLVDYMAPQLYWAIDPPAQSYPVLLKWWIEQSTKGRHVYAGNAAYKMAQGAVQWQANEIVRQVNITRSMRDRLALGNIYFSTKEIMRNVKGIQEELAKLYKQKAIIPKMNWL